MQEQNIKVLDEIGIKKIYIYDFQSYGFLKSLSLKKKKKKENLELRVAVADEIGYTVCAMVDFLSF